MASTTRSLDLRRGRAARRRAAPGARRRARPARRESALRRSARCRSRCASATIAETDGIARNGSSSAVGIALRSAGSSAIASLLERGIVVRHRRRIRTTKNGSGAEAAPGPVGERGFEPPTSASRTLRANRAALLPAPVEDTTGHACRQFDCETVARSGPSAIGRPASDACRDVVADQQHIVHVCPYALYVHHERAEIDSRDLAA